MSQLHNQRNICANCCHNYCMIFISELKGKSFSKQMCASVLHFSEAVLAVQKINTNTDGPTDIHYRCS